MEGPINGGHVLKGLTEKYIVHGGTKIYSVDSEYVTTELYSDANDHISVSVPD